MLGELRSVRANNKQKKLVLNCAPTRESHWQSETVS